jgi:mannose-6-phosphate isomerase
VLKTAYTIEKPWGHEEVWASSTRYVGKILFIKQGHRLSRQYHKVKEETIMVLEGELTCEHGPYFEGDTIYLEVMQPGEIFHVFPGTIHRFCAETSDVKIIEVSSPEIQDVTRLEDDYRRITDIPKPPPTSGK